MKVIVTYRNFHDIDKTEIPPQVFLLKWDQKPEDALREIWENEYNALLAEQLQDGTDCLNGDGCWYEEDMAVITWADGDTKEFYVVEMEMCGL